MKVQYEELIEQSNRQISRVSHSFKRYLFDRVDWTESLIGIKGARGTGKTTLVLQWLKEQNFQPNEGAYFSLDDLYFTDFSLKETAAEFYKRGGKAVVLDEVHKYNNWSREVKNLHDFYPDLKIIFTGSSIIDISKQEADLSRRALIYELHGLSFREYLIITDNLEIEPIDFESLLRDGHDVVESLPQEFRPLRYFQEYLQKGYYPFGIEKPDHLHQRLNQLIRTIVEYDMAELKGFDVRNARKLLHLLYIIAQQVPFKPNLSSLASKTDIHRNSINNYLYYLEEARLIGMLRSSGKSVAALQKPEKLYLNNTNLMYALSGQTTNSGTLRETFAYSQLTVEHMLEVPEQGDFLIDNHYTFEIGGRNKKRKQLEGVKNAFVIRDDIEQPAAGVIPLWMLGLIY